MFCWEIHAHVKRKLALSNRTYKILDNVHCKLTSKSFILTLMVGEQKSIINIELQVYHGNSSLLKTSSWSVHFPTSHIWTMSTPTLSFVPQPSNQIKHIMNSHIVILLDRTYTYLVHWKGIFKIEGSCIIIEELRWIARRTSAWSSWEASLLCTYIQYCRTRFW